MRNHEKTAMMWTVFALGSDYDYYLRTQKGWKPSERLRNSKKKKRKRWLVCVFSPPGYRGGYYNYNDSKGVLGLNDLHLERPLS